MKLEDFEKEYLIELLVSGYSNTECVEICDKQGFQVERSLVNYYRKKYSDEIKKKITEKEIEIEDGDLWEKEKRAAKLMRYVDEIENKGLHLSTDRNGRLVNSKVYMDTLKQIGHEVGDFKTVTEQRKLDITLAFKNLDVENLWLDDGNTVEGEIIDTD
jgi:hypothetical protein